METCKRCRGNGFGDWHVQQGVCWACEGRGSVKPGTLVESWSMRVVPSSRGRRLGHQTDLILTYSREVTIKNVGSLNGRKERMLGCDISGVDKDGKAVQQSVSPDRLDTMSMRLAQNDDVLVTY